MPYTTAVTLAIARVLGTLTRLLKPLTPPQKLQVLQHVLDTAGDLHGEITRQAGTKGT